MSPTIISEHKTIVHTVKLNNINTSNRIPLTFRLLLNAIQRALRTRRMTDDNCQMNYDNLMIVDTIIHENKLNLICYLILHKINIVSSFILSDGNFGILFILLDYFIDKFVGRYCLKTMDVFEYCFLFLRRIVNKISNGNL